MDENAFRKNLTPRALQIMDLVAKGHTSREISEILQISHRTVEVHKANTFKLLGVSNSIEAVMIFTKTINFRKGFMSCANVLNDFIDKNHEDLESFIKKSDLKDFISTLLKIGDFYNYENIGFIGEGASLKIKNKATKSDIINEISQYISQHSKNRIEISDFVSAKLSVSSDSILDILEEFSDSGDGVALWSRTRQGRKGYVYLLLQKNSLHD